MSKKQVILLTLIVCLPLALLGWLGVRLARDEQSIVRQHVRNLLTEQLRETDQMVARHFELLESDLLRITDRAVSTDAAALRVIIRSEPRVSQLFMLDREGRLIHPRPGEQLNENEEAFLVRANALLLDKDLIRVGATTTDGSPDPAAPRIGSAGSELTYGWHVWYWERGLNLIFWRRGEEGRVIGVELARSRWMSDLIVELPETAFDDSVVALSRIRLADAGDNTVYQWGGLETAAGAEPFVEMPLSAPLSSWRLKYYVADERFNALGRGAYVNLFAALGVLGIGLVGLAFYLYRESSREIREAATRVNFVNQVSHELKTPLTNIRMYADLLEHDLEGLDVDQSSKPQQRLEVIIAESGRLSRLIGNVLTFAKQQRHQIAAKPRPGQIDVVIREVIRQFQPMLEQKGVDVQFAGAAAGQVEFDADVVEQILVNLISNVEKYGASGGRLSVASEQAGERSRITIADEGPGVSASEREKIFQPFYRASRSLEEAAGAGIGLSIARNLARMHGGDVVLLETRPGATFQIELHTPLAKSQ